MGAADVSDIAPALFELYTRLGDDRLVHGHRLSEWCGKAPILEEELAIANIALDCLGHARLLLEEAGNLEGKGRSADDLAYLREAIDFKNLQLVEQPPGDFAFTIGKQFLFDVYSFFLYDALQRSSIEALAGIAQKAFKEIRYHLRHSSEWVLRLGDGTEESRNRMQDAVNALWRYTREPFERDDAVDALVARSILPEPATMQMKFREMVTDVLTRATLSVPSDDQYMVSGSRRGIHSEHLGHMLSEMQILARSYPGAVW